MMAAAQPFLSGAISKTVNLPASATIDEIENLHLRAWKLGLKSIAIYRDGSKNFQPLRSNPECAECGSETELVGSCWRCPHCGFVLGCS
jgi:ribonucleoside-diphosphate reductase alpha chain